MKGGGVNAWASWRGTVERDRRHAEGDKFQRKGQRETEEAAKKSRRGCGGGGGEFQRMAALVSLVSRYLQPYFIATIRS